MDQRSGDYVLGLDGGGTSTTAWLAECDSALVLGRGESGPSNPKSVGHASARLTLEEARKLAFADAGIKIQPVSAVCLGLAGVDREEDKAEVESWIASWSPATQIVNDTELVIAAANPKGWGIALIAGTGSNCVGKAENGSTLRAGGWGPLIGDEGSAYGIAIEAMRRVVHWDDGRTIEPIGAAVLRAELNACLGTDCSEGWVSLLYEGAYDRARIASLAQAVQRAAEFGSAAALDILNSGASELAAAVLAVYRRLPWKPSQDSAIEPVPLGLAGGFVLNSEVYRTAILENLRHAGANVVPVLVPDPVTGALQLARIAAKRSNARSAATSTHTP